VSLTQRNMQGHTYKQVTSVGDMTHTCSLCLFDREVKNKKKERRKGDRRIGENEMGSVFVRHILCVRW